MNKYKVIFDSLKKKVGSDAARMISYEVYDSDSKKEYTKINSITEKTLRNYGGSSFIPYMCFYIDHQKYNTAKIRDKIRTNNAILGTCHFYVDMFEQEINDIYEYSYKPNIVSKVWEE